MPRANEKCMYCLDKVMNMHKLGEILPLRQGRLPFYQVRKLGQAGIYFSAKILLKYVDNFLPF